MKIRNDKYYTSPELAKYVVEKANEIIGKDNITEYLEPSAGDGVFIPYLLKPFLAYDIEPENPFVIKENYLDLKLHYKIGRCIIGNPPYGVKNTLTVQFFKKSIQLGDYIVFILPISQLNNTQQMYEFDLIYSEDLGKRLYSDREVHCCLNIYRKNINGLNKKPNYKLKDVKITEYRRGNKNNKIVDDFKYDIAICAWGSSTGQVLTEKFKFAQEFYITINNNKYKEKIIELIKNADWCKLYYQTKCPSLYQWQIYKYLKKEIPELEWY